MKKIFITLFFALTSLIIVRAQEQAVFSQYPAFPILVNPALTGFEGGHQFLANARSSWTGFPGAPKNYTALYNGLFADKLGLGGGISSEKIGEMNQFRLQLNYAFHFRIQKARISLGLNTDFLNRRINPDLLNDPTVQTNDDVLERLVDGESIFDATFGAHALFDEKFFVSLAIPNVVRASLDQVPVSGSAPGSSENNTRLFSHYNLQIGYIADIASQNFKIIPSLAVRKFRDTPIQVDLNVQGRFLDEKLLTGLTFRPSVGGSMAFMLGTKLNDRFMLMYAYDLSFGPFQTYNGGGHELTAAYRLGRKYGESAPASAPVN